MTASLKMRQLESKISDLQAQHQLLMKERQQEISTLLMAVDLAHLDDKTLMGAFLFLKEKSALKIPLWRFGIMPEKSFCASIRQNRTILSSVTKEGNNRELALNPQNKQGLVLKRQVKKALFSSQIICIKQQINRLKNQLNRENYQVKLQRQSGRKSCTHVMIQAL